MERFTVWKARAMVKLVNLRKQYENDAKISSYLDSLISKLHYAKARDISRVIFDLHLLSKEVPEVLELIPSEEDVKQWLTKEQEQEG